jgi:hypothetical protein
MARPIDYPILDNDQPPLSRNCGLHFSTVVQHICNVCCPKIEEGAHVVVSLEISGHRKTIGITPMLRGAHVVNAPTVLAPKVTVCATVNLKNAFVCISPSTDSLFSKVREDSTFMDSFQ